MIGVEVTIIDKFDDVEKAILDQSQVGMESMAEAVLDAATDSMEYGGPAPKRGYKKRRLSDKRIYESAPEGEPPRWHTGGFIDSIDIAIKSDRLIVGSKSSDVGLRGAWFEFGGRPLKPGEKMHPRQKKWKQHPWIRPALKAEIDTFAPRVAGSFV